MVMTPFSRPFLPERPPPLRFFLCLCASNLSNPPTNPPTHTPGLLNDSSSPKVEGFRKGVIERETVKALEGRVRSTNPPNELWHVFLPNIPLQWRTTCRPNTGSSRWKFTLHTTEIFYTPSSIDFLRRTTTTLVVSPHAEVICGSRRQIRRAHFSLLPPSFFLPFSLSIRMLLRLSTLSLCRTVHLRKGVLHHRRWRALCRRASWSSIRLMPFSNPARSSEPVRSGSTASLEG